MQLKKPKKPPKKPQSKWPCRKQLVQDGTLVELDMGHLGYLLTNFANKKTLFSCSGNYLHVYCPSSWYQKNFKIVWIFGHSMLQPKNICILYHLQKRFQTKQQVTKSIHFWIDFPIITQSSLPLKAFIRLHSSQIRSIHLGNHAI